MAIARGRFRFTIGQGMIVIAALAVAFAIMPMPVAIMAAFLTCCLVVLARKRLLPPNPTSRFLGCFFSFCGLVGGLMVGSWLLRFSHPSGHVRDTTLFWIVFCGLFSALTACIFGRFLGGKLAGDLGSTARPLDSERDKTQAQLELVERLLRQAHQDDDQEVMTKLSDYKTKLEHKLQL
jgi:hypothetical protein